MGLKQDSIEDLSLVIVEERQSLFTRFIGIFQIILHCSALDAYLINKISLHAELGHWHNYCVRSDDANSLQGDAINVLNARDEDIYSIIFKQLQILCTLPVTNSTGECSFSTLHLIKTWLRTTMLQKRLTRLALMISIDLQAADVID